MKNLKILLLILIMTQSLFSSIIEDDDEDYVDDRSMLITKISTKSTQEAGMGVILALNALKYEKKSIIIIGGNSIKFIRRGAHLESFKPATLQLKKKTTVQNLLKTFIRRGGKIFVCNLCLIPDHLIKYDILKGIEIVNGKQMTNVLFMKNSKIISF